MSDPFTPDPGNAQNGDTPWTLGRPPNGNGNPVGGGSWITNWDSEFIPGVGCPQTRLAAVPVGQPVVSFNSIPLGQLAAECSRMCPSPSIDMEAHDTTWTRTAKTSYTLSVDISADMGKFFESFGKVTLKALANRQWESSTSEAAAAKFPHNTTVADKVVLYVADVRQRKEVQTYLILKYYSLDEKTFAKDTHGHWMPPAAQTAGPAITASVILANYVGSFEHEIESQFLSPPRIRDQHPCGEELGMTTPKDTLLKPVEGGEQIAISGRPYFMEAWTKYSLENFKSWVRDYLERHPPSQAASQAAALALTGRLDDLNSLQLPAGDLQARWVRLSAPFLNDKLTLQQKSIIADLAKLAITIEDDAESEADRIP